MSTSRMNQILQSAARRYVRMTPDERYSLKILILGFASIPWMVAGLYLMFDTEPSPRFDGMSFLQYIAALNCTIFDRSIRVGNTQITNYETICYGENQNTSYSLADEAREIYDAHEFDSMYLHLLPGIFLLIGAPIIFVFLMLSVITWCLSGLRDHIPGEMLHHQTPNIQDILHEFQLEDDLSDDEDSTYDESGPRHIRVVRTNRTQTARIEPPTTVPEIVQTSPAQTYRVLGGMFARAETIEDVIEDFHRIEI